MKLLKVPCLNGINKQTLANEAAVLLDSVDKQPINIVSWPQHNNKPVVSFAAGYTDDFFLLKFYVAEQYVPPVYQQINDPVHEDSCVEFFISFDNDGRYYNFEFNSIGTCFAGFGTTRTEREWLTPPVLEKIKHQTLIKNNDINGAPGWELTLVIPGDVFCYHAIHSFKGKTGRVNFHKCGDKLPQPHYLTWNKIDSPRPDFHLPQFFGGIAFV
jgi:hypothetical protein